MFTPGKVVSVLLPKYVYDYTHYDDYHDDEELQC